MYEKKIHLEKKFRLHNIDEVFVQLRSYYFYIIKTDVMQQPKSLGLILSVKKQNFLLRIGSIPHES